MNRCHYNIRPSIINIGFSGISYYNPKKEPPIVLVII